MIDMAAQRLLIAGVPFEVRHRAELTSWVCAGHETDTPPEVTVSASEAEIDAEYAKLGRFCDRGGCEGNILYRKVGAAMLGYDGFLLHSAAVAVDGEGYVFTAPGGTGKSTHVNYWLEVFGERAYIVNGDKPILRRMDGKFHVCGTPWRGKEQFGRAVNVPLKAVVLLERARENFIIPADPDEVLDKLAVQLLPFESPDDIIKQLDLLDALLGEVPIYRLGCNMSPQAAETAYTGINEVKA